MHKYLIPGSLQQWPGFDESVERKVTTNVLVHRLNFKELESDNGVAGKLKCHVNDFEEVCMCHSNLWVSG